MPNTQPPTSDYETKLDTILLTFAKKIENMPRGKTYDWENEKQAITSLLNTELDKKTFTTYTGESIKLCNDCPQFKREDGWQITQCNHCETSLKERNHG
jgi:hypothetical protein